MSQPVKLSDTLVLDARITGELMDRSIAGQVEFWAQLGRSIEPLLQGDRTLMLRRNAATRPLSDCLATVDTAAGRERLRHPYRLTAIYENGTPAKLLKPIPLWLAARCSTRKCLS